MIDPEGRHDGISRCGTTNDFAPSNKRSTTTSGKSSSDSDVHIRTSTKASRITAVSRNPNHSVFKARLAKDPNRLPKGDTRLEMSRRRCTLCR